MTTNLSPEALNRWLRQHPDAYHGSPNDDGNYADGTANVSEPEHERDLLSLENAEYLERHKFEDHTPVSQHKFASLQERRLAEYFAYHGVPAPSEQAQPKAQPAPRPPQYPASLARPASPSTLDLSSPAGYSAGLRDGLHAAGVEAAEQFVGYSAGTGDPAAEMTAGW